MSFNCCSQLGKWWTRCVRCPCHLHMIPCSLLSLLQPFPDVRLSAHTAATARAISATSRWPASGPGLGDCHVITRMAGGAVHMLSMAELSREPRQHKRPSFCLAHAHQRPPPCHHHGVPSHGVSSPHISSQDADLVLDEIEATLLSIATSIMQVRAPLNGAPGHPLHTHCTPTGHPARTLQTAHTTHHTPPPCTQGLWLGRGVSG